MSTAPAPNAFAPSETATGKAQTRMERKAAKTPAMQMQSHTVTDPLAEMGRLAGAGNTLPVGPLAEENKAPIPMPEILPDDTLIQLAEKLIKGKKIAQLITRKDGEDLPVEDYYCEGPEDGVLFIGHPFLMHRDGAWQVPIFDKVGELRACFFDKKTHCVVFVRAEAYPD